MRRRLFVNKEGTGVYTKIFYTYEGYNKILKCDVTDWKMYKLWESLIDSGADERKLNELLEMKYEEAYEEALLEKESSKTA